MEGVDWWRDKRGERNVNRLATTLPLLSDFEKVINNAVWFDSQKVVAKKMKKKKVFEPSRILKKDINFKTDHNFLKIPTHWQSIFHSPPFILCKRRMIPLCSPENQVTPTPPPKKNLPPLPTAINNGCLLMPELRTFNYDGGGNEVMVNQKI